MGEAIQTDLNMPDAPTIEQRLGILEKQVGHIIMHLKPLLNSNAEGSGMVQYDYDMTMLQGEIADIKGQVRQ